MIGLVTARAAARLDPDLAPLDQALRSRLGDHRVSIVAWDDPGVDWSAFTAVVLRSTWDYADHLPAFLAWVDRVELVTTVVNPSPVVRWSADKRYLADLAVERIPVTPTVFVAPGEPVPPVEGVHVVKPSVGAGSNGARRCAPADVAEHVSALHAAGHTAMVQPYLELLDARGETAHCFVASPRGTGLELSHAFRKGAILTHDEVEREGDLFAREEISTRTPSPDELALARRVLATEVVTRLGDIAFARVDIAPIRRTDGEEGFVVMELELIEPSFYFPDPAAVTLFADRLLVWLARRHRSAHAPAFIGR
jgi:hypothetical protein